LQALRRRSANFCQKFHFSLVRIVPQTNNYGSQRTLFEAAATCSNRETIYDFDGALSVCMFAHTNVALAVKQQHDNTLNPPLGFIYDDVNARKTAHLRINLAALGCNAMTSFLSLFMQIRRGKGPICLRAKGLARHIYGAVFSLFFILFILMSATPCSER
jgi:hypothetical protein